MHSDLDGHTSGLTEIRGALELTDGRVLLWDKASLPLDTLWSRSRSRGDETLRLWDLQSGGLLETVSEKDAPRLYLVLCHTAIFC